MKKEFFIKLGLKKIRCLSFPKENPLGVILIVHGLGEHIDRYEQFSREFRDKDFAVYGSDHAGHGKSSGIKGNTSVSEIVSELDLVLERINADYPLKPVGIFGHSLGGLVAVRYVEERPGKFFAAAFSAPAVKVTPENEKKTLDFKTLAKILPFLTVENGLKTDDISRNKNVVKEYIKDPMVHSKISLKLALSMVEEGKKALENAGKIKIPTLVVQGSKDRIILPEWTESFFNSLQNTEKKYIPFENAYHEVFFDPELGDRFRSDIIGWFRRQI